MPRAINLSNPLAATRHALGPISIEEFGQVLDYGISMLKHVEAGRKPMNNRLAEKVHECTRVPFDLLFKAKISKAELATIEESVKAWKVPVGDGFAARGLSLLPEILALYVLVAKGGNDPLLALRPIKREIGKTAVRWNVRPVEFERLQNEFLDKFFGPLPESLLQPQPSLSLLDLVRHLCAETIGAEILEAERLKWVKKNPLTPEQEVELRPFIELRNKKGKKGV